MVLWLSVLVLPLVVARKLSVVSVVQLLSWSEHLGVVESVKLLPRVLVVVFNAIAVFIIYLFLGPKLRQTSEFVTNTQKTSLVLSQHLVIICTVVVSSMWVHPRVKVLRQILATIKAVCVKYFVVVFSVVRFDFPLM